MPIINKSNLNKLLKQIKFKNRWLNLAIIIAVVLLFHFVIQPYFHPQVVKIELVRCIDGDTTVFKVNNKEETVRLLAVDTPERGEPFSNKATTFVCDLYQNAELLEFEYDSKAKRDKYQRLLGWVWVDDTLIQQHLLAEGYAKIAYLYDDYKYTNSLFPFEAKAKADKLRIWSIPANH